MFTPLRLVSMESIRGISVPMYTTLRRTKVVFTVMAEYFLARKKYSSQVVAWYNMYANFATLDSIQWRFRSYEKFPAVIFLSCALAFLLNYCVFLNTTINSALTQTVCGNLKDLFTVGFGWIVFRELPFDLLNIVGQCLSFLGSCLYAYCKQWHLALPVYMMFMIILEEN
ncbi:hypothetical protein RND71_006286 [Anisodus tanguticus]|uniref:Sugar phosphate transporter domain-containing protein n=1 Tax=Anisodus tanguticus TaxID=243964 RepID=A0AAE1VVK5_9SOLA|nr:hypothetical protein RND71_006286 [Anisodus tanguticus]